MHSSILTSPGRHYEGGDRPGRRSLLVSFCAKAVTRKLRTHPEAGFVADFRIADNSLVGVDKRISEDESGARPMLNVFNEDSRSVVSQEAQLAHQQWNHAKSVHHGCRCIRDKSPARQKQ